MSPLAMGAINEADHTIEVTVPSGTDVTALVPTIINTGAGISPESGAAQDFSAPVTYTVTAEDESTQEYTVIVTVASSTAKAITGFSFTTPAAQGYINEADHSISVIMPHGTNVTSLVPTITHTGASITPTSGAVQDFTGTVTYTVTAADASMQDYSVNVSVAASDAKEITSFSFASPTATGVISGSNITVTVPYGTNVTALVATFTTTGASVTVTETGLAQTSGTTPNDFTSSRTYRVAAADGTTRDYTVTANRNPLPTVTTTSIAGNLTYTVSIAGTSAQGGGNVTDQGSSAVTERGLCWNTLGSPTTSNSKASGGSGTGSFAAISMTGLGATRIYFVRAYATNSSGTSYGNEITFDSGYTFGTDHAGGYVFYNDGSGGGLVSAKSDQGDIVQWTEGSTMTTGATGRAIGTGQSNTDKIIAAQGAGSYAAQVCNNYDDGIYSDWFLPSADELKLMCINLRPLGINIQQGWSSTEILKDYAAVVLTSGSTMQVLKVGGTVVRAVRAF